ncbi:biotin transporter BioY [Motilibacter deserti]|uniref:Biotin transporter n=1 Tax=Motilibacter deserti TaxID=2714956 RepID=A0ABX0GWC3_9ACTN|nr:biotin transporter BioY [Motilibacter deserti]NHC15253.1 biotin transporter BioY [Motilibacter deserti]
MSSLSHSASPHAPRVPRVLADLVPRTFAADVALVLGAAALIGVCAQVSIPLWPVPLTLQTFAVLLAATALGSLRSLLATTVYLLAGVAGMPWFSDGRSGWGGSPSFGYILGFLLAALVVGRLSERMSTRSPWRVFALNILGSALIYAVGVPWLMATLHVGVAQGLDYGLYDFVPGDLVKSAAAAGLLPATWALVDRIRR